MAEQSQTRKMLNKDLQQFVFGWLVVIAAAIFSYLPDWGALALCVCGGLLSAFAAYRLLSYSA